MSEDYKLVTPPEAARILDEDPRAILVDVRSDMEYLMIGHPKGAHNVPWIDYPDWDVNPHFVAEVRKLMLGRVSGDRQNPVPVLLICRSANRSVDAAHKLAEAGINDIYVVDEGFEGPLDDNHQRGTVAGWRFHGLPWEQV